MGRRRMYLAAGLAFLLEWGLLFSFPLRGTAPRLLPALVCLAGLEAGPDRGAECGFFAGLLCYLTGASPWQMAFFTLLGGIPGVVFHKREGFWGNWLLSLPALAGWEGLQLLAHCLSGGALPAGLHTAGLELLLAALCFPAAFLLLNGRLPRRRRGDYGGRRKGRRWRSL